MKHKDVAKIGFFGGTFDPIHYGHLHMAEALMQAKKLDEIWFCPAAINPFKSDQPTTPIEHRLEMVQRAISDQPGFRLLDIEAKREGPSYTVDTLRRLASAEPKQDIYLIISDELVADFFRWLQPEEIIKLAHLLIGSRQGFSKTPPKLEGNPNICRAIEAGWTPTTVKAISSTEIRQRLHEGLNCRDLVPNKVLDYISQNNLYSSV